MPLEQHPTDPDKLVMRAGNYNLQKPWVDLTDEEIQQCYNAAYKVVQGRRLEVTFARAISVKLKDKNT